MSTEPPSTPTTNTRTIHHSAWHQQDDIYIYRVTGSGFLHHMVRNLVGTFVQTATGHIALEDIPKILAARNRSAAGYTAPARGLFSSRGRIQMTDPAKIWVPHLRDGLIVAKVGIVRSTTAPAHLHITRKSEVQR